jgi:hypothetical protein
MLLLGIAIGVLMVPAIAIASHRFDDVPTGNVFHEDITWLADAGITLGCDASGTLFCPDDPVTRGQMAAFMHRYAANLSLADFGEKFIQASPVNNPLQSDVIQDFVAPVDGGLVVNLALNCESTAGTVDTRWDVDITVNQIQAGTKAAVLSFHDYPDFTSRKFSNSFATVFWPVSAGTHDIGIRAQLKPEIPNDETTVGDGNLLCDVSQTAFFVP